MRLGAAAKQVLEVHPQTLIIVMRLQQVKMLNGYPATRSSIRRLEKEVTALRNQLEVLQLQVIRNKKDMKSPEEAQIEELRTAIEHKESLILQLKLIL